MYIVYIDLKAAADALLPEASFKEGQQLEKTRAVPSHSIISSRVLQKEERQWKEFQESLKEEQMLSRRINLFNQFVENETNSTKMKNNTESDNTRIRR